MCDYNAIHTCTHVGTTERTQEYNTITLTYVCKEVCVQYIRMYVRMPCCETILGSIIYKHPVITTIKARGGWGICSHPLLEVASTTVPFVDVVMVVVWIVQP